MQTTELVRQCKYIGQTGSYDNYTAHTSLIGQPVGENRFYAQNYNDDSFTVNARTRSLFHFEVLRLTMIQFPNRSLGIQKDFL